MVRKLRSDEYVTKSGVIHRRRKFVAPYDRCNDDKCLSYQKPLKKGVCKSSPYYRK